MNIEPTLEMLNPATLLIDLNIREGKLDKDFVASVKDHGVIEPIVAVRTSDGQLRVRHGHRRTIAAIEAAHPLVPVVIVGTEDNDEANRIAKQWHENQHRAALTNAEEIGAVDQLALLGLSASAIAKRLRSPKKHVENALAVRSSDLARAAAARYNFLTLDQAAAIADFEANTETVKALVVAAKAGDVQFQRAIAQANEDRAKAVAYADLAAALTTAGVSVVDPAGRYPRLDHLADDDDTTLTAEGHRVCPGHAAYIIEHWQRTTSEPITPDEADEQDHVEDEDEDEDEDDDDAWTLASTAVYVCTDPDTHGHHSRFGSRSTATPGRAAPPDDTQRAAETEKRRTTLANNKAWRAAEPIRRDWLRTLATRKTPPKGAAALIATALTRDTFTLSKATQTSVPYACDLLGVGTAEEVEDLARCATDARAVHIALITVLAAYEDNTRVDTWRSPGRDDRRYFAWLAANGYPLSDVEALAAETA